MTYEFRQLNMYELPETLLTQAYDGELSAMGVGGLIREAFGGAPVATPGQRDTLEQRLRAQYGGNAASDALIGVLTNPLSYLALLGPGLHASKIGIGKVASSAWVRERAPFLGALHLLTGGAELNGTPAQALGEHYMRAIAARREETMAPVQKALESVHKRLGITDIYDTKLPAAAKQSLRDLDDLLHVRLEKLNQDVIVPGAARVVRTGRGPNASFSIRFNKDYTRRALVNMSDAELDRAIDDLGGTDLLNAMRGLRTNHLNRTFLDKNGSVDADKVTRLYHSLRFASSGQGELFKDSTIRGASREMVTGLFGNRVMDALERGHITEAQFKGMVDTVVGRQLKQTGDHYVPMNVWAARDMSGRIHTERGALSEMYRTGLLPSRRLLPQRQVAKTFDVDDLERLANLQGRYGASQQLGNGWYSQFRIANKYGKQVNIRRKLGAFDAFGRYDLQMSQTQVLFGDKLPDELASLMQNKVREARLELGKRGLAEIAGQTRAGSDLYTPLTSNAGPRGGATLADALDQTYRLIRDKDVTGAHFKNELIPLMLGRTTPKHAVTRAITRFNQSIVKGLDNVGVLDSMAGVGMRRTADTLKTFSKMSIDELERNSGSLGSRTAGYLYTATLGFPNLSSPLANMSQPIITLPRFMGADSILHGYKEGFKQFAVAIRDVVKSGGTQALNDPNALRASFQKNVRLANVLGEDLTDITSSLVGNPDVLSSTTRRLERSNKGGLMRMLMAPFQGAEVINRITAAEATAHAIAKKGMSATSLEGRAAIGRIVQETQFAATTFNTPRLFQAGLLSHPLLKQFAQFPMRMLTSPLAVEALDGPGGYAMMAKGFARAVGFSAIAYETVRATTGIDTSRYGVIGATFQIPANIAAGETTGPIPLPPVLSLGAGVAAGLTQGDTEMLRRTLPLLVPGGVGLDRIMRSLGPTSVSERMPSWLRPSTSVGWDQQTPDGMVPVYKSDGTLVTAARPRDLVLKASGLDFGRFSDSLALDRYLATQRDEMVRYERQAVDALLAGDSNRLNQLQNQFQQAFGFQLKLDRSQLRSRIQSQTVTRAERVLDRMSPEARAVYGGVLSANRSSAALALGPDGLGAGSSASHRDAIRLLQARINPSVARDLGVQP